MREHWVDGTTGSVIVVLDTEIGAEVDDSIVWEGEATLGEGLGGDGDDRASASFAAPCVVVGGSLAVTTVADLDRLKNEMSDVEVRDGVGTELIEEFSCTSMSRRL